MMQSRVPRKRPRPARRSSPRKASAASRAGHVSGAQETRERLLKAAARLFAAKGYDGVSVKELAVAAGANISLVSYHFGGKDGLYRACLEQFGKARLEAAERTLTRAASLEEFRVRLQMFVEEFFECNLAQSDLSRIIQRECDLELPHAIDIFKNTFLKVFETLVTFFKAGQSAGLLRKDFDAFLVAGTFFGGMGHFVRSQQIGEKVYGLSLKDPKYRGRAIQHLVQYCIFGCVEPSRLLESESERSAT